MPLSPVFCNELHKITPFSSAEEARRWLQEERLTNNGTTLLTPFKDEYGIRFLKPENSSVNEKLRIIGMANHEKEKTRWQKFEDLFRSDKAKKCRVPHVAEVEGEFIIPDDQSYLFFYKKGEENVGELFYSIFHELTGKLIEQVKASSTNDPSLKINARELMDKLSIMVLGKIKDKEVNCDIWSGRMYFIVDGELFRYTFKKDLADQNEIAYLAAETKKEAKLAERIEAHTEKKINHHYWSAFKGYCKVFVLGIAFGFGISLIPLGLLLIFVPGPFAPIIAAGVAATVGVIAAALFIKKGIKQVAKENEDTLDYGKTTFKTLSSSVFSELKKDFLAIFSKKTEVKSNEDLVSEVTQPIRPVELPSILPASKQADSISSVSPIVPSIAPKAVVTPPASNPIKVSNQPKKGSLLSSCFSFFKTVKEPLETLSKDINGKVPGLSGVPSAG